MGQGTRLSNHFHQWPTQVITHFTPPFLPCHQHTHHFLLVPPQPHATLTSSNTARFWGVTATLRIVSSSRPAMKEGLRPLGSVVSSPTRLSLRQTNTRDTLHTVRVNAHKRRTQDRPNTHRGTIRTLVVVEKDPHAPQLIWKGGQ